MTEKYERWTISKMKDYRKFCGWSTLQKLINAVEIDMKGPAEEILIHGKEEQEQARAIIATTFETGARIGEVLGHMKEEEQDRIPGLRKRDFQINENEINVFITVEKQYDKIGEYQEEISEHELENKIPPSHRKLYKEHPDKEKVYYRNRYETNKTDDLRRITIPRNEPLVSIMTDWVESHEGKLFDKKYNWFYRTIKKAGEKIGENFPPHRLRAERATQIILEYEEMAEELTDWMSWSSIDQALDYTVLASRTSEKMMEKANEKFGGD